MSVRSVLCLLVVLTCYRNISAQGGIGSTCTTSDDCNAVNDAACVNKVCVCLDSHVPHPLDNRRCLPKVKHDQTCSESIQCSYSAEAECVSGKCQCKSNFNYNGELCVGSVGLGQPCGRDSECVVPYDLKQERVWCRGSQCACRQGFRRDGDRCVIGGDCETNDDCNALGNSYCNIKVRDRYQCACNEGFLPAGNNTKCLPIANQIGSGCEYDEQCSHNLGKAVCSNYQCRCAEGTSLRDDTTCGAAVRVVLSLSSLMLIWVVKLL